MKWRMPCANTRASGLPNRRRPAWASPFYRRSQGWVTWAKRAWSTLTWVYSACRTRANMKPKLIESVSNWLRAPATILAPQSRFGKKWKNWERQWRAEIPLDSSGARRSVKRPEYLFPARDAAISASQSQALIDKIGSKNTRVKPGCKFSLGESRSRPRFDVRG